MNIASTDQPGLSESGIVQRVRKSLQTIPGERPHVLLACSAGKDSVALASVLVNFKRLNLIELTIAHINHAQHEQADVAADAVEEIGTRLAVPVHVRYLERQSIAGHAGVGLEEALRRERYLALSQIATDTGADCIALAHHQTDQAETMLLHLMRGSGVDGLAGMQEHSMLCIPWWTTGAQTPIQLWRPLLHEPETLVAATAADSGLPIVEDPTNADKSFRRNAIRHELLPLMEQIAPGTTAAIARSGTVIAQDAALLADGDMELMAQCIRDGSLVRRELNRLPGGWQSRVIRAWLMQAAITADITHDRISAIVELSRRNRGGSRIQLGQGVDVVVRNGMLVVEAWQNRGS